MQFVGYQLDIERPEHRSDAVDNLRRSGYPLLILNTCQRLEYYGVAEPDADTYRPSQKWTDMVAFERLARIAAGLESRILGELEILGQTRNAYKEFQLLGGRDASRLDRIFQDALALARKARRESGIDRNLTSLSALAARELLAQIENGAPVAVVGSGSMAGRVARYLGKRGQSPVRVTSRCPERAMSLAMEVGGFGAGLDELTHLLDGVAGLVTATAAPHPVVYAHHLSSARFPLTVIDLGVPPDCHDEIHAMNDVRYIGLETIEAKAHINTQERRDRAEVASRIIRDGAIEWFRTR